MFPMLSGLFIKGDNGWVVLAHKTISVPLMQTVKQDLTKSLNFQTVILYNNKIIDILPFNSGPQIPYSSQTKHV